MALWKSLYQYLPRIYGLEKHVSARPLPGLLHPHTPASLDEDILDARNFSLLFKGSILYFSSLALVQIYETANGILLVLSMPMLCLHKDEMTMKIGTFSLTIWDVFWNSSALRLPPRMARAATPLGGRGRQNRAGHRTPVPHSAFLQLCRASASRQLHSSSGVLLVFVFVYCPSGFYIYSFYHGSRWVFPFSGIERTVSSCNEVNIQKKIFTVIICKTLTTQPLRIIRFPFVLCT